MSKIDNKTITLTDKPVYRDRNKDVVYIVLVTYVDYGESSIVKIASGNIDKIKEYIHNTKVYRNSGYYKYRIIFPDSNNDEVGELLDIGEFISDECSVSRYFIESTYPYITILVFEDGVEYKLTDDEREYIIPKSKDDS